MTACTFCEQPMDQSSCLPTAVVENIEYHRIPYDPDYGGEDQRCHDCAVRRGWFHHPGCDMERCPRCLDQAIWCGCRWEGDELGTPEHPEARRVGQERDGSKANG